MPTRMITIDVDLNVRSTVRGAKDPVMVGPTELWWSTRTPDGTGTLSMQRVEDDRMEAEAWGAGSTWLLDQAPRLLGHEDDLSGFEPDGVIRSLWRRSPFKLGRTDRLWDSMLGAILGQKVQVTKAVQARRTLARQFGEPSPGPRRGWVLPSPQTVGGMGYFEFHPVGVERNRAEILVRAAREMPRIESFLASGESVDSSLVEQRLQRIRGIGPWTAAMVTAAALGNADAVPVGDFHLPNSVAWTMAQEPRATDERMLELLEPYKGHRWRVIRLAKAAGGAPKYGPRLSLEGDGLHRGR